MNNPITRAAATVMHLADGATSQLKGGVRRAGTQLVIVRDGSRKAATVVKRNPGVTIAAVAIAAGAGIAWWLLRRNKQRRGLDEEMRTVEVKSVRIPRKTASKRVPRKTATKPSARVNGGA